MTPTQGQQMAINEFISGYGTDTVKEYGQTFFELIITMQQSGFQTESFMLDVSEKLTSLYRLISALEAVQPLQAVHGIEINN